MGNTGNSGNNGTAQAAAVSDGGMGGLTLQAKALRSMLDSTVTQYDAYRLEHYHAIAEKTAAVKRLKKEIADHRRMLNQASGAMQAVSKLRDVTDKAAVQARLDGSVKAVEMQNDEQRKQLAAAATQRPSALALAQGA